MKINLFPTALIVVATFAIGYLAFHVANSNFDTNDFIVGIGTGVSVLLTLGCVIGVSLENSRQNTNLKAWGIMAFIILAIVNFCFAGFGVSMPYYVIVLTLLLVIHLWVAWKISIIKNV